MSDSSNIQNMKKQLWEDLLVLMGSFSGSWIFLGDFNCVRDPLERKNSRFNKNEAEDFNSFINAAGLAEYSMMGCTFTYVTDDGLKLSKIDRVLVCHSFLAMWPAAKLWGLTRHKSDHRPLLLLCSDVNFDKLLAVKLKAIKAALKPWCDKIKEKNSGMLKDLQKKVETLDLKAESVALTEQEIEDRNSWLKTINELDDKRLEDLKQRAKVKWAVDGDENTAFFHGVINGHRKNNRINGLNFGDVWISQPEELKEKICKHFESIFLEQEHERPRFINNGFKALNLSQSAMLVKRFTKEEIKEAVWSCGGDKTPGPDGFTFMFLKDFWDIFEQDFGFALDYFYVHGKLNRGCNSSFISLIPKINNPQTINDFRPINLIGCISKVVTKILASRLKKVIGSLVSDVQTAYIEGRSILEGPLIINELISLAKSSKKKMMLFKVDFEKAFDSLSWEFLDSVLSQMGFPALWRKWVTGLLKTARTSILVNGSPTFEFDIQRGVRQGDPLSPLLFILAMEALHIATDCAVGEGIFKGMSTPGEGPTVSHLLYADDVLFVGEWSESNFYNLARLLRCFHLSSGLKVNFVKSKVFGVGVRNEDILNMASILGCERGSLPFTYLGLPVGSNMGLVKNWKPVIDRFESKLSLWKARTLSFGGRTTLVKAVLGNLPTYYFSLFNAPLHVIKYLEKVRRKFLWGGCLDKNKMSWVPWFKVVAPKEHGGLGIGSLASMNKAMMVKWIVKFRNETSHLWTKVIKAIHGRKRSYPSIPLKSSITGVWKNIVNLGKGPNLNLSDVQNRLEVQLGKGDKTFFWLDKWAGNFSLRERFPSLFTLENEKHCFVEQRYCLMEGQISWVWGGGSLVNHSQASEEWNECVKLLEDVKIEMKSDEWLWRQDETREVFKVNLLRTELDSIQSIPETQVLKWLSWIPKKINCFLWRAVLDRIPTREALAIRNINIPSVLCALCGSTSESVDHLLISCQYAQLVWTAISLWVKIPLPRYLLSLVELLEHIESYCSSKEKKKALYLVAAATCWTLWRIRNNLIFNQKTTHVSRAVGDVKALSFLWMKARAGKMELVWKEWGKFNCFM
ncbi:putative RNA-directed DNA polymerase [Helianthus annuus]|nr:putative RNA-directed DNA polymerase [Helianthus annuus]